ncbi:MAG: DUF438 domain-containing protein [Candidatus Latescibacterota bacterium]
MAEVINNRQRRIELLKEIIGGLHEGVPQDQVREKLRTLVRQTDAGEIAAMEQQLMDDGMPVAQVMAMCDLHSQVVSEVLVQRPGDPVIPGHPVDTFRRENVALRDRVARLRNALTSGSGEQARGHVRLLLNELMSVDRHYARKEMLLFPILERHGIAGPSKVMWGKDDEVRRLLRELEVQLRQGGDVTGVAAPALVAVEEMVRKEEEILLPMSLETLTASEWAEIWEQTPQIGYCLVEPGDQYRPERETGLLGIEGAGPEPPDRGRPVLVTPTGVLTLDQLKGMLAVLPVDVTFVDAEDRVRYFSHGARRIFARSRAVIGRKVQHCHPPASVAVVERILADFRAGRKDSCSFWIDLRGRFVLIRYYAVRGEGGEYLGTLEVTQDLTEERRLQGERRLLQYDT